MDMIGIESYAILLRDGKRGGRVLLELSPHELTSAGETVFGVQPIFSVRWLALSLKVGVLQVIEKVEVSETKQIVIAEAK
jgi:hypothetical protein